MAEKVTNMTAEEFYNSDLVLDGRATRKNTVATYSELRKTFEPIIKSNPPFGEQIEENIKLYLEGHGSREESIQAP